MIRETTVFCHGQPAGTLKEMDEDQKKQYVFTYFPDYQGPPISLTMPTTQQEYTFDRFPPVFDGLLPEGFQLEALLRQAKLDARDYFGQLVTVCGDTVGAITIQGKP